MPSEEHGSTEPDAPREPASPRAHVGLPPPRRPLASTRQRILYAASVLLSLRGYAGTSIRSIVEAIGVRGPSIYHHFDSKDAIVEELLDYSLAKPVAFAELMLKADGDIAVRFYRYVRFDIHHMAFSVNDLRGLHTAALMSLPQFRSSVARLRQLRANVRQLILDGVSEGRFRDIDEYIVVAALEGIFNLNPRHYEQRPEAVDAAVDFLCLALLADPSELGKVREQALAHRQEDETFDSSGSHSPPMPPAPEGRPGALQRAGGRRGSPESSRTAATPPMIEDVPQLLGAMQEEVAEIRQTLDRLTEGHR